MTWADLAVYLREELGKRGQTQQWLQETTQIPDSTLSRILNGQVDEPRASQIAAIGRALNIPFWTLMNRAGITDSAPDDPDAEALRIAAILKDDPDLRSTLGKLTGFDERDRKAVHAYIKMLQQERQSNPQSPPESE